MIRSHDMQFGKELFILYPGDYHAVNCDCVFATVTGSCLVVCLFDSELKIGGMGHFIVPGTLGTEGLFRDEIAAHGITNMEYLIGEIVKLGGDRKRLKGKLFGAADLSRRSDPTSAISMSTIRFIHEYATAEKIPIISDDLGGNLRRKIFFFPQTGRVYRKVLRNNSESSEFVRMEKEYIDRELRGKDKYGKVILFGS